MREVVHFYAWFMALVEFGVAAWQSGEILCDSWGKEEEQQPDR
jgi:hypothetical protein